MIRIQEHSFDVAAEIAAISAGRTDIGAVVTFTGLVRDTAKDRKLAAMTLEHYPGMTERELGEIEAAARARWQLDGVTIIHRYGRLVPGDPVVLVVTASSHRRDAFEAAEFLMDYLKTRAPFWKKETALDGSGDWVDARETDATAEARWRG
jgi:molybdopterin synthase catalytic subunit